MPETAAELEADETGRALLAQHTFDNLPPQTQQALWQAAMQSVEVGIALQNGHWGVLVEALQELGGHSLAAVVDRHTPNGLED